MGNSKWRRRVSGGGMRCLSSQTSDHYQCFFQSNRDILYREWLPPYTKMDLITDQIRSRIFNWPINSVGPENVNVDEIP
jgi:hypothetical protein